jgi:hypothetical protein
MTALRKTSLCLAVGLALIAVLALESTGFAQCAMCKTALAGSSNAMFIRSFNIGVLVLLIPPVTIFCSIFVVLRRYKTSDEEPTDNSRL